MRTRQELCFEWAVATFGDVAASRSERAMRFIEEAVETIHASGQPRDTLTKIIDRTYSRPAGEIEKEIGQAMLTLEALAESYAVVATYAADREFDRVRSLPKSHWESRHAAKTEIGITADSPTPSVPG